MDYAFSLRQLHLSRAKLKASSQTSALLSGFAMVALVELDLGSSSGTALPISRSVLLAFAICTTLLVSVHLLALMMSTCILPHMDSVLNVRSLEVINESPHVRMRWYIELAWCFSTVVGLLLFLLEIAIVFWIKFTAVQESSVPWITTGLLALIFVVFIGFTYTFYNKLSLHKYELSKGRLEDLQQYFSKMQPDRDIDIENGIQLEKTDKVTSHNIQII
ncbi:Protein orai-2 [Trichinella nelsoni]|uniref:Protein orai-2 n=3 Tax=Trichinella TaxID=6333 RepID=A0A0V0ZNY3_9BILA|nr:Protein orai-2 [Trichinella nelsoni]KRY14309.1 Protein orai-2 [Trichinella patagoniensis]